ARQIVEGDQLPLDNRPRTAVVSSSTSAQSVRMKLFKLGTIAPFLLLANVAHAGASPLAPRIGDTYEITLTKESSESGSNGSSGSSRDSDALIERVIGLRADGLELEYDLPPTATAGERANNWQ